MPSVIFRRGRRAVVTLCLLTTASIIPTCWTDCSVFSTRPESDPMTDSQAMRASTFVPFAPLTLARFSASNASRVRTSTEPISPRISHDDDARALIKKLGAREFVIREEATQALWELGPQVESDLQRALRSDDRETVARAQLILDRFRHGIFPNTPIEVVVLIEQFRTGDKNARAQVLQQLVAQGETETVERLVDLAETPEARREVADWILGRFDRTLAPLILDNQLESLERILLAVAYDEEDIAMCTAVLRHRHRLAEGVALVEQRIQDIQSRVAESEGSYDFTREHRMLISFHHAQGNQQAVMSELAEVPNAYDLTRAYLIASRDWDAWSDWEKNQIESDAAQFNALGLAQIEPLSFAALAHHLAGNTEQRDKVLAQVRQLSEENKPVLLFAGKCMFAVDRPEEAIQMFQKRDPNDGFSLLCQQHRYEEAFAALGMELNDKSIETWVESLLNPDNLTTQEGLVNLYSGLDVCAQLALIGHTELAQSCYDRLANLALEADSPQPTLLREICRQEFLLGFEDLAWSQMERLFQTPRFANQEVLRNDFGARSLFPQDYVMSNFWWKVLTAEEEDTIACLQRIKQILETHAEDEEVPPHFQQALASALAMISHNVEDQQLRDYSMLADTCLRANLKQLARKYYEQAFELGDGHSAIKIGDIAREANAFDEAAKWYGKAYQVSPHLTWTLYLQGVCLEQSGNAYRGRELKEQGRLLSLQSPRALQLADSLRIRDMSDEAAEIWESVRVTTIPLSTSNEEACERLGSALAESQPERAAMAWEQNLASVMSLNRNLAPRTFYLSNVERVHRTHAFALLNKGDIDGAWERIQRCEQIEPGSSEVPEYLVPRLEKAGADDRADELFGTYFDHYEELLTLLPNSALHHNNLAWFSARCERRLDEALKHARRAVEIEPTSSNYLDTLAEILFLQGNPEEAAKLAEQCIAINPVKAHYREQLVRFQTAIEAQQQLKD